MSVIGHESIRQAKTGQTELPVLMHSFTKLYFNILNENKIALAMTKVLLQALHFCYQSKDDIKWKTSHISHSHPTASKIFRQRALNTGQALSALTLAIFL